MNIELLKTTIRTAQNRIKNAEDIKDDAIDRAEQEYEISTQEDKNYLNGIYTKYLPLVEDYCDDLYPRKSNPELTLCIDGFRICYDADHPHDIIFDFVTWNDLNNFSKQQNNSIFSK